MKNHNKNNNQNQNPFILKIQQTINHMINREF